MPSSNRAWRDLTRVFPSTIEISVDEYRKLKKGAAVGSTTTTSSFRGFRTARFVGFTGYVAMTRVYPFLALRLAPQRRFLDSALTTAYHMERLDRVPGLHIAPHVATARERGDSGRPTASHVPRISSRRFRKLVREPSQPRQSCSTATTKGVRTARLVRRA